MCLPAPPHSPQVPGVTQPMSPALPVTPWAPLRPRQPAPGALSHSCVVRKGTTGCSWRPQIKVGLCPIQQPLGGQGRMGSLIMCSLESEQGSSQRYPAARGLYYLPHLCSCPGSLSSLARWIWKGPRGSCLGFYSSLHGRPSLRFINTSSLTTAASPGQNPAPL